MLAKRYASPFAHIPIVIDLVVTCANTPDDPLTLIASGPESTEAKGAPQLFASSEGPNLIG